MAASVSSIADAVPKTRGLVQGLREEKQRQILAFELQRRQQQLDLADYVEAHPDCLETARRHVDRFLSSPAHARLHWVLEQWRTALASSTPAGIAAIFRNDDETTRALRESPPYFGPLAA